MSILDSIMDHLEGDTCDHPETPDGSGYYWYTLRDISGREYWCEYDAVYVKLRSKELLYTCVNCGEMKHISTAEEVGGEENIVRKKDIRVGDAEKPSEDIDCGAYKGVDDKEINQKRTQKEVISEFEETLERKRNYDG